MGSKRQWFKDTFNRGLRRRRSVPLFGQASSPKTNAPTNNESEAINEGAATASEDTNNGNSQPPISDEQRNEHADTLSQASTLGAESATGPIHISPTQTSDRSVGGHHGLDGAGGENHSQQPSAQVNILGYGSISYGSGGVGRVNGTQQSGERSDQNGDYWDRNRSVQADTHGAFTESTVASREVSPYRIFTEGVVTQNRVSPAAAGLSDPEPEWDGRLDESEILPPTHRNSAGRNSIHADYLRTVNSSPATASQRYRRGQANKRTAGASRRRRPISSERQNDRNNDGEDHRETSNGAQRPTGLSSSGPQPPSCVSSSNPVTDSKKNGGEKSEGNPTQQSDGPSTPSKQSTPNGRPISSGLSMQQSSGKKSKRKKKRGPLANSCQGRLPIGCLFQDRKDDDEELGGSSRGQRHLTAFSQAAAKASRSAPSKSGSADTDYQGDADVIEGLEPDFGFTYEDVEDFSPDPDYNKREGFEWLWGHSASTVPGERIISHLEEYSVPNPLTPPHTPESEQEIAHSPLKNQQDLKLVLSDATLQDWIDLQHIPTADAYVHALLKGTIMNLEADLRVPFKIVNVGADLTVDRSCSSGESTFQEGLDMANGMDLSTSKWQRPNDPYHARLWRLPGEMEKLSAPPLYSSAQFEVTVREISPDD